VRGRTTEDASASGRRAPRARERARGMRARRREATRARLGAAGIAGASGARGPDSRRHVREAGARRPSSRGSPSRALQARPVHSNEYKNTRTNIQRNAQTIHTNNSHKRIAHRCAAPAVGRECTQTRSSGWRPRRS
jgi:hypothetical protein